MRALASTTATRGLGAALLSAGAAGATGAAATAAQFMPATMRSLPCVGDFGTNEPL